MSQRSPKNSGNRVTILNSQDIDNWEGRKTDPQVTVVKKNDSGTPAGNATPSGSTGESGLDTEPVQPRSSRVSQVYNPGKGPAKSFAAQLEDDEKTAGRSGKKSNKNAGKKNKTLKKVIISIVCVILALILALVVFVGLILLRMKHSSYTNDELAVQTVERSESDIKNIVFLGIDKEENRSDVMMVISINKTYNQVNVVSILRDSKVPIEISKHDTKIGFAYKWGGVQMAMRTINQNFGTDFNKYVTMNFDNVIGIIDALGGIDLELTADEALCVNDLADEMGYYVDDAVEGWNHLNGTQSVAYARTRKIDSEAARAGRQQKVILAMVDKLRNSSKLRLLGVAWAASDGMETNLTIGDFASLALLNIGSMEINRYTIPDDRYETDVWGGWETVEDWSPDDVPAVDEIQWVWIYDIENASWRLKWLVE